MRRKLPELDKGMGTLIADLADRGLLDTTIVWWGGEFGRTPKVDWSSPWNGGRHHYGHVFSTVVAGGGFKGGQVVGSSDAKGEYVQRPARLPLRSHRDHVRVAGNRSGGRPAPSDERIRPRRSRPRRRPEDGWASHGNHTSGAHHESVPTIGNPCRSGPLRRHF